MATGGCTNCGSQENISIGGKPYCASCGQPLSAATPSAPIGPGAEASPAAVTPVAAPVLPVAKKPLISDVGRPNPGRGAQVLDLRANQAPSPARQAAAAQAQAQAPITTPRIDMVPPTVKTEQRVQAAADVSQHPQITKFAPIEAAPTQSATPTEQVLPNAAATTHEAMQKLITGLPSTEISPTAIVPAPKSSSLKASLAVASVVLAAMGAYIWYANYPKMAVKIAGSRAGLAASYPNFLPSSYKLSGAVAYGSGEVTYKLASPAAPSPLTVTEHQTSWDSKSLDENYVKGQTDNASTVSSQGLTVYLFSGKATWVNHGIWYTLEGIDRLSQDQILHIVDSL